MSVQGYGIIFLGQKAGKELETIQSVTRIFHKPIVLKAASKFNFVLSNIERYFLSLNVVKRRILIKQLVHGKEEKFISANKVLAKSDVIFQTLVRDELLSLPDIKRKERLEEMLMNEENKAFFRRELNLI